MAVNVGLDWSVSLEGTDDKGKKYTFTEDKLDRQKYARFIVKFLADQGYNSTEDTPHNYVLNLNSEWGSGKTYFLKRLSKDLKDYYPTVYIDAWAQDYSEDPLMTVISSMIKQLRVQAGKSEDDLIFKAPRKLVGLFKAVAPAVARGLSKRYIGIDPAMIMDSADDADLASEELDDNGKPIDMGVAASKLVSHLIEEHDAKANAIESIKTDVGEWVKAVIAADNTDHTKTEKRKYPAFVFIDELDRCRPSYAVEMLETIKHIFDIPGVVFVVGTDTEQLQHAVKVIYGEGFDARNYLGRFFNSRFTLRQPDFESLLEVHCDPHKLSSAHFSDLKITVWPENDSHKMNMKNITTILNCFDLSARQAIQITERIIAILSNLPKGKTVDILMLTFLLCIREKDELVYDDIFSAQFVRVLDGTSLDLHSYLLESYRCENKRIFIDFDPRVKHPQFRGVYPNRHSESVYVASLTYYLDIFVTFFGHSPSCAITLLGGVDDLENEPIEVLLEELRLANPHTEEIVCTKQTTANSWLGCTYYHEGMDKLTPSDYKDLVELSSSLDWLDE